MKKLLSSIGALAAAATLALTACSAPSPTATNASQEPKATEKQTVTVFAAASLNQAFEDIATAFAVDQPDISVTFSFDASSALVDQIQGGAPADVFASADEINMDRAVEADLIEGEPSLFATNVLTIIIPKGNPAGVTGFDESLDGTKLVICADGVPCGNATRALAEELGVTLNPVSEEPKVTDVRGKVESGEADAGMVYTTDAKAAGDKVEVIAIPGADTNPNRYPIAIVKGSKNADAAKAFIDFVLSDSGRQILDSYGFGTP